MTQKPILPLHQGKAEPAVTQQQVADDFDQRADSYEQEINKAVAFAGMEHAFYLDVKRDHLLRLTSAHFGSTAGLRVLDLGCGIGAYHKGLEQQFREVHGVDVSPRSVKLAAQKHSFVHYRTFDGMTLPYPDAHFDMVYTICVMHHVPPAQWEGFIAEIARVTRPDGLAIVFEHNPYNPATQYIVRSCEIDNDAVLLRPVTLRRLFDNRHFKTIVTRSILTVPPKGALLERVDRALGWLPFGAQYYLTAIRA